MARLLSELHTLWEWLVTHKPSKATGIYVTSVGISFGYRTNIEKMPENYLHLWPPKPALREQLRTEGGKNGDSSLRPCGSRE